MPMPAAPRMYFDRGVKAVVRGAARCALRVHGSGARTDACGRSFAVFSTQVSLACACGSWCQDRCLRPFLRGLVDEGFSSWLAPAVTICWREAACSK
jgi:hypothetical protein